MIETATRKLIDSGIPHSFRISMTYASWRSPFCPDPRSFRNVAIGRLNEGCLLWVYMGHGSRRELDWIKVPAGRAPILHADDCRGLNCQNGSPIAVFLSCHSGAYSHSEDCLAEDLLREPGGPIAVVAGSGVTLPYGMAVLGHEMLHECFSRRADTLGSILLHAKRRSVEQNDQHPTRRLIDSVATIIGPHSDRLDEERREHVLLINLLGDPLLRLRHAKAVVVNTRSTAIPGDKLEIELNSEVRGTAHIELVCGRGQNVSQLSNRTNFDGSDAGMRRMNAEYRLANDDCWSARSLEVDRETSLATVVIPDSASGECHIRVYVQGERDFANGSARIYVRRAKMDQAP
jgi:hypothetical protein